MAGCETWCPTAPGYPQSCRPLDRKPSQVPPTESVATILRGAPATVTIERSPRSALLPGASTRLLAEVRDLAGRKVPGSGPELVLDRSRRRSGRLGQWSSPRSPSRPRTGGGGEREVAGQRADRGPTPSG